MINEYFLADVKPTWIILQHLRIALVKYTTPSTSDNRAKNSAINSTIFYENFWEHHYFYNQNVIHQDSTLPSRA
jgi:predicted SAM-dependent methyltransferase